LYHIGKVFNVLKPGKDVLGCDESVQAVVEMWDRNVLTFMVHPKISAKIKKGDYVLVDYKPISEKAPIPRHTIIKIIKGKTADGVWKEYKRFFSEKQKKASQQQQPTMVPPQYFG